MSTTETNPQTKTTPENVRKGITSSSEFHTNHVTITDPRKRKNAKGDINFNALVLHGGRPLYLETPWLRAPFGASLFEKEGGKKNYSLALNPLGPNLDDEEENVMIQEFFDQLEQLDAILLEYGWNHRNAGFFSEVPEVKAVVKALYSKCVKQDKEKQYPRRLNLSLPMARDEDNKILDTVPGFDIYKDSTEPYPVESFTEIVASMNGNPNHEPHLIEKGAFCRCIIQPRIWFIAGKFGVTWSVRALELKTIVKVNFRGKYAFSRPDGEEASDDDSDADSDADADADSVKEDSVEDSGEEEEEEEEED